MGARLDMIHTPLSSWTGAPRRASVARRGKPLAEGACARSGARRGSCRACGIALTTKRLGRPPKRRLPQAMRQKVPSADIGPYAFLQLSAGKFERCARDIFEQARAAEPQAEAPHRFLAFVHAGIGDWATSERLYESAHTPLCEGDDRASPDSFKQNGCTGWSGAKISRSGRSPNDQRIAFNPADAREPRCSRARRSRELRLAYRATAAGNPNHRRDIGTLGRPFRRTTARARRDARRSIDEQPSKWYTCGCRSSHRCAATRVQDVHARDRHGRVLAGVRLAAILPAAR